MVIAGISSMRARVAALLGAALPLTARRITRYATSREAAEKKR
jgi:hypothetical protein